MAKKAAATPIQSDEGAFAVSESHTFTPDRPVLFGLRLDQVDRITVLRLQADAVLGLLRHAGPDTPEDYIVNAAWMVQDLLVQIQAQIEAAVRFATPVEVRHD